MIITHEQLESLDEILFVGFVNGIYQMLREDWVERSNLHNIVYKQVERALDEFSFREKKYVLEFVNLSLEHTALAQDIIPEELIDILTWPNRNEITKLDMLRMRFA